MSTRTMGAARPRSIALLLALSALLAERALAHYRPLGTEDLSLIGHRQIQLELGAEFRKDETFPFSGLEGDLLSVGTFALEKGVGPDATVFVRSPIYNRLKIRRRTPAPNAAALDFSGNETDAAGNATVGTKLRFRQTTADRPGFGFQFAVELPNTPNETGLGSDTFNFSSLFIGEMKLGRAEIFANVGMGIMGEPASASAQKDKMLVGLGFSRPLNARFRLLGDVTARSGSSTPGTEDRSTARLALQQTTGDWRWDAGVMKGIADADAEWGLTAGVTRVCGD